MLGEAWINLSRLRRSQNKLWYASYPRSTRKGDFSRDVRYGTIGNTAPVGISLDRDFQTAFVDAMIFPESQKV
jgi:hypothetical protein